MNGTKQHSNAALERLKGERDRIRLQRIRREDETDRMAAAPTGVGDVDRDKSESPTAEHGMYTRTFVSCISIHADAHSPDAAADDQQSSSRSPSVESVSSDESDGAASAPPPLAHVEHAPPAKRVRRVFEYSHCLV